jgi:hypothetical protein
MFMTNRSALMTPQNATLDSKRTLSWFASYRRLSAQFQFSLSADTLGYLSQWGWPRCRTDTADCQTLNTEYPIARWTTYKCTAYWGQCCKIGDGVDAEKRLSLNNAKKNFKIDCYALYSSWNAPSEPNTLILAISWLYSMMHSVQFTYIHICKSVVSNGSAVCFVYL